MSSGQWEVVGKSKKSQNGKIKNAKDEDKKPTKNGPKLEDVGTYTISIPGLFTDLLYFINVK